jgi:hypothetical protein
MKQKFSLSLSLSLSIYYIRCSKLQSNPLQFLHLNLPTLFIFDSIQPVPRFLIIHLIIHKFLTMFKLYGDRICWDIKHIMTKPSVK